MPASAAILIKCHLKLLGTAAFRVHHHHSIGSALLCPALISLFLISLPCISNGADLGRFPHQDHFCQSWRRLFNSGWFFYYENSKNCCFRNLLESAYNLVASVAAGLLKKAKC